jgi:signal transduction histidine kinase
MAEEVVRLRIEDDGAGFDPAAASGEGMGLLSMRERSELLGGSLVVDSRPGAGTRLTAEIPLDLPAT